MVYSGDQLLLKSDNFFNSYIKTFENESDPYKLIINILTNLSTRRDIKVNGVLINEENRTKYLRNYLFLYKQVYLYYESKKIKKIGRPKMKVSFSELSNIRKLQLSKDITLDEAVKRSGLGSKETYYRRLKDMNE